MVSRLCFALVGVLNRFVVLWKFITKHLFLALGITTIIFFFLVNLIVLFLAIWIRWIQNSSRVYQSTLGTFIIEEFTDRHYIRNVDYSAFTAFLMKHRCSCTLFIITPLSWRTCSVININVCVLKTGVYQRSFSVSIIHLSLTWHLLQIYVFVLILW